MRRRGGGGGGERRGAQTRQRREDESDDVDDTSARKKPDNGTPRKITDCATCVTYAFLVVFFVVGVLITAADRQPPQPSRGTPNTPWNQDDGMRAGGTRGEHGNSRGDPRSSSYQHDDDDDHDHDHDRAENKDSDEDGDTFRDRLPDIGLWEGLGIIVIDRLSKVKDYLEGMVHTLERWKAQLEDVNENLDAYLEDAKDSIGVGFGAGGEDRGGRRGAVRGETARGWDEKQKESAKTERTRR